MRRSLVVGNWKMYGTLAEALSLAGDLVRELKGEERVEVAVCPPFTVLSAVGQAIRGSAIALGAQDCHWEAEGAFTGEVSPAMLADQACRYVILGHSERRRYFGESDEAVNWKARAALTHGLVPIACVGETREEREGGRTAERVAQQVRGGLGGLGGGEIARLVLAYEPVWAIGTGLNATPTQAAEVHRLIRGLVGSLASPAVARELRILYGGSVKPENASELFAEEEIDGGLIGGASLKASTFVPIVLATAVAKSFL